MDDPIFQQGHSIRPSIFLELPGNREYLAMTKNVEVFHKPRQLPAQWEVAKYLQLNARYPINGMSSCVSLGYLAANWASCGDLLSTAVALPPGPGGAFRLRYASAFLSCWMAHASLLAKACVFSWRNTWLIWLHPTLIQQLLYQSAYHSPDFFGPTNDTCNGLSPHVLQIPLPRQLT